MTIRIDEGLRRRFMKTRIILWSLSLCLFGLAWHETRAYARLLHLWSVLFLLACVAGLFFEAFVKRGYRCTECGRRLAGPDTRPAGDRMEYVYPCESCGFLWRTKTYAPND